MIQLGTEYLLVVEIDGGRLQLQTVIDAAVERLRSLVPLRLALAVAALEALSLPCR